MKGSTARAKAQRQAGLGEVREGGGGSGQRKGAESLAFPGSLGAAG